MLAAGVFDCFTSAIVGVVGEGGGDSAAILKNCAIKNCATAQFLEKRLDAYVRRTLIKFKILEKLFSKIVLSKIALPRNF